MSKDRSHPDAPAVPLRGQMVSTRQLRHHYLEAGAPSAPPVVLLHGLASLAQDIMAPLGQPLAQAGYHVVAFDRPGYGQSPSTDPNAMSPLHQAEALADAVARLNLRGAIVVAHCVGAATALLMVEQAAAAVSGLVLVNPFCRPTRPRAAPALRAATAPMVGSSIRRLLPSFAGLIGRGMVRAGLQDGQPQPDPKAFLWQRMTQGPAMAAMADELQGFNDDVVALRTRLKRLTVPTIILADPDDPVIAGAAHVRWLTQRLPVQAVRWSPGGHLLHHADPDAVVDAVLSVDVARQVGMRRIA